jgi:glutathione S-transferase
MRLFWTPASPFVRKVMVVIHELDIANQIEIVPTVWPHEWATRTIQFDPDFIATNPVGRIPALIADDGTAIAESSLICRYLVAKAGGSPLIPKDADLPALRLWGIGDGALEAMIARRAETLRSDQERSEDFLQKQKDRISRCFDAFDVSFLDTHREPTMAQIVVGIACGYMDFRFPADDWRSKRSKLARWYDQFAQRQSMTSTVPAETPQRRHA